MAVAGTYINFDVPNAVATQAWGVNSGGHVVGNYDDGSTNHGFIRHPSGFILTFDVPGSIGTLAYGINSDPDVVGYYFNADYVGHGFIRRPGNLYTHIDVPGAGTLAGQGTYAYYINDAGQTAGSYFDPESVIHGFIRDAAGNYSSIDPHGSVATAVRSLNQSGEAVGTYWTSDNGAHGFLRDAVGNIRPIDYPGAVQTYAEGINTNGEITGFYWADVSGTTLGFVRDAAGDFTSFDPSWPCCAGDISGITDAGDVVGDNDHRVAHGFRFKSTGALTLFSDPSAGSDKGEGTFVVGVSGNGNLAGWYIDSAKAVHGFVWKRN